MNPIDILGSILGRRSPASGRTAEDAIKQGRAQPKVSREPTRREAGYEPETKYELPSDGDDLDDLLADAVDSFNQKTGGEFRSSLPEAAPPSRRSSSHRDTRSFEPEPRSFEPEPRSFGAEPRSFDTREDHRNQQALIMVRAMIMAAKSDGRLDADEQEKITGELGDRLSREDRAFLEREFKKPVDIKELARMVPRGMEKHVYAASVMAIDLDSNPEAQHLHHLAKAFGLSPDDVNDIHRQVGAPALY